jgi:hypothetical protein
VRAVHRLATGVRLHCQGDWGFPSVRGSGAVDREESWRGSTVSADLGRRSRPTHSVAAKIHSFVRTFAATYPLRSTYSCRLGNNQNATGWPFG